MFKKWFSKKNKALQAAQRNGQFIDVVGALLDEFHDDAQKRMRMANELKHFAEAKLHAVTMVVALLEKNLGQPELIKEIEQSHARLLLADDSQNNILALQLLELILKNTKDMR